MLRSIGSHGMYKYIFLLALITSSSFSLAAEFHPIGIAKANYNNSISKIDEIEAKCEKSETVLDKRLFSEISADKEQLKTAVIYYYFKAKTACTGEAVKDYLLASAVLSSLDKDNRDAVLESDMLIVETNVQLVKHQAAYEILPDNLKDKLSDIRALYTPFNLIQSIEKLGL
jgi:hypothetical protein